MSYIYSIIKEAEALADIGKYKEALNLIEPYIETFYENTELLTLAARCYAMIKEYEKSIPILVQLSRVSDNEKVVNNAILNVCVGLHDLGKVEMAIKMLEELLKNDGKNPYYLSELGACYLELGEMDKAFYYVKASLDEIGKQKIPDKNKQNLLLNASYFLLKRLKFRDSRNFFKKVLDINPLNMDAIQGVADCSFNLKNYTEAKKWYEKLFKYYPNTKQSEHATKMIKMCEEHE